MQFHGGGIAERQDQSCPYSPLRADGAEYVAGSGSLIVRRSRPGSPPGPSACGLGVLAHTGLVLEPDLDGTLDPAGHVRNQGGEVFLDAAAASPSWA